MNRRCETCGAVAIIEWKDDSGNVVSRYCDKCYGIDRKPWRELIHQKTDFVRCSRCGKQVSNVVVSTLPEGIVVRAWVECPECIEKQKEKA